MAASSCTSSQYASSLRNSLPTAVRVPLYLQPVNDRIDHPANSEAKLPPAVVASTTTPAAVAAPPVVAGGRLAAGGALEAENDEGSVEYKWRLTNVSAVRLEHLKTQMKFRVAEGNGQCYYEIGVSDSGCPKGLPPDDYDESLATVRTLAGALGFSVQVVHERVISTQPELLRCAELLVIKQLQSSDMKDLRIAFCGHSDAGKSTLVSVMVHGALDDGSGAVRQGTFNHKHEVSSGRTSSVSHRVLGFDETGRVTNYDETESLQRSTGAPLSTMVYGGASLTAAQNTTQTIAERSVKLVTLMDLGGDRRYSKTTLLGITSRTPGYACVCVTIDRVQDDLMQYVQLCRALRIPFFVVLTKIDRVSELEVDDAMFDLCNVLQSVEMDVLRMEDAEEVDLAVASLGASVNTTSPIRSADPGQLGNSPSSTALKQKVVPVIAVSSVEGTGITLLKQMFHKLPVPALKEHSDGGTEVLVDTTMKVAGVGVVVSGYMVKGVVKAHDTLLLGPDRTGQFHPVTVHSIHVKHAHVNLATAGLEVSISLGALSSVDEATRDWNRKGTILVDRNSVPNVCFEFEMQAEVLTKEDSVSVNQEPVVHCRNIRQAARIIAMEPDRVGYQQQGRLVCRFLYNPEVLDVGSTVLLRWNQHAKMIGTVTSVRPLTPPAAAR